jgi:hypothetical protein
MNRTRDIYYEVDKSRPVMHSFSRFEAELLVLLETSSMVRLALVDAINGHCLKMSG